jgi:hypothetical protein
MIPKDSNSNHYLKESQAEKKGRLGPSAAVGRTVRPYLADRPPVWRGPSARVEGARCGTGGSRRIFRPSAMRYQTIRAPCGPSAGTSQAVRACHAQVGPGSRVAMSIVHPLFLPTRKDTHLSISLLFSLKKGPPPWGFRLLHSPDRPSTSTDSLARFSTMSPGYFLNNLLSLSLSLSNFE